MNTNNPSRSTGDMFIIGALFGALVAVMLAPDSGKQTREKLMRKARDMQSRANERARHTKDTVDNTVKNVKETVAKTAENKAHSLRDEEADNNANVLESIDKAAGGANNRKNSTM